MKVLGIGVHREFPPSIPKNLKDRRADPLALAAIHAFSQIGLPCDPLTTACIALVSDGCPDHLEKVLEASKQKLVRPGNFTRMGPHTIATYLATAVGLHGPAFSLLGGIDQLKAALNIAKALLFSRSISTCCLFLAEPKRCSAFLLGKGEGKVEEVVCLINSSVS